MIANCFKSKWTYSKTCASLYLLSIFFLKKVNWTAELSLCFNSNLNNQTDSKCKCLSLTLSLSLFVLWKQFVFLSIFLSFKQILISFFLFFFFFSSQSSLSLSFFSKSHTRDNRREKFSVIQLFKVLKSKVPGKRDLLFVLFFA